METICEYKDCFDAKVTITRSGEIFTLTLEMEGGGPAANPEIEVIYKGNDQDKAMRAFQKYVITASNVANDILENE